MKISYEKISCEKISCEKISCEIVSHSKKYISHAVFISILQFYFQISEKQMEKAVQKSLFF
jgi:hypothetical protein